MLANDPTSLFELGCLHAAPGGSVYRPLVDTQYARAQANFKKASPFEENRLDKVDHGRHVVQTTWHDIRVRSAAMYKPCVGSHGKCMSQTREARETMTNIADSLRSSLHLSDNFISARAVASIFSEKNCF